MENNKNEVIQHLTNMEFIPTIIEDKHEISQFKKVPFNSMSTLGLSVKPFVDFLNQSPDGEMVTTLYKVTIPKGTKLAKRTKSAHKGAGNIGTYLTKTNEIGGQATLNKVFIDPTTLMMNIALVNIESKLLQIEEMQKDLMDYLVLKDRSEIRGDLNFLQDVHNNYKHNWDNEKYKTNNHIKVLDIKQSSERKIDFFKEKITKQLNKKSFFNHDKEVKSQLETLETEFKDYQLSLYLFSFSSFLETMLLENFDSAYLTNIISKIEKYASDYRYLYTNSYTQLETQANKSIQSRLLRGAASANKLASKALSKVPVVSNTQIDEKLEETGKKLIDYGIQRTVDMMDGFIEKQKAYVRPFIENIQSINELYNKDLEIVFDNNTLYVGLR